jgi:hypothetical protein
MGVRVVDLKGKDVVASVAIISAKDLEAAGVEQNHESGQGKPAASAEQPA